MLPPLLVCVCVSVAFIILLQLLEQNLQAVIPSSFPFFPLNCKPISCLCIFIVFWYKTYFGTRLIVLYKLFNLSCIDITRWKCHMVQSWFIKITLFHFLRLNSSSTYFFTSRKPSSGSQVDAWAIVTTRSVVWTTWRGSNHCFFFVLSLTRRNWPILGPCSCSNDGNVSSSSTCQSRKLSWLLQLCNWSSSQKFHSQSKPITGLRHARPRVYVSWCSWKRQQFVFLMLLFCNIILI